MMEDRATSGVGAGGDFESRGEVVLLWTIVPILRVMGCAALHPSYGIC